MKTFSFKILVTCFMIIGFSTVAIVSAQVAQPVKQIDRTKELNLKFSDPTQRMDDGDGKVAVTGEMKQWHKITLTLDGPFAHELDTDPNPFTDYKMTVRFVHISGSPVYEVPGYFAADGNAAETGADNGIKWRAHLSPDKTGEWNYEISFQKGKLVALVDIPWSKKLTIYDGIKGSFTINETDKAGRDFRSKGRLEYVGKNHLQFQGDGTYLMKAGPDSPETFLGYADFDGTYTVFSQTWKVIVPLKSYEKHIQDWQQGDPTWQNGKGKGMIGALNYLSSKGLNAFSFLTYNAGGDGDNVWPFIKRDEKYHYDCSKLDQWQIIFDHAQVKGLYLHFKMQETEIDDNISRGKKIVIESLDGGDLGPQRILYCRELIARFSYLLALNWNLGEENTQSTQQLQDMSEYLAKTDPYKHNIVLHTYPNSQDNVYTPLLDDNSKLTGLSLQNPWNSVHKRTLKWIKESNASGKPWVVANDEQNPSLQGVPPDPGFGKYAPNQGYDINDVRKQVLWGNIMAGGAGVEYYFGDIPPESDMQCENYRSRDKSWTYCAIALDFLKTYNIPFWEMVNSNKLINNLDDNQDEYCFAKEGELYLVYLGYTPTSKLDLSGTDGRFTIKWFNPRDGGKLINGKIRNVKAGAVIDLGPAPGNSKEDWLVIVQKSK